MALVRKIAIFYTAFSFHINISVKIRARLLRNLCGTFRRKVRQRSVEWIERDVPAINEVEKLDEISGSLVQQVMFPLMQRASLGRAGLVHN